jgi:LemA protein
MIGYAALGLGLLALLWAIVVFNGLVRRRNIVAEAWSGIDTQLKRRADLIPNLIETVKGYAAYEKSTFELLAQLRSISQGALNVAARAQTEQAIMGGIGRILAVAEAYPQLRASENFQSLQKSLAEIEDQIQLARRYYNATVRDLNIRVEQFPSNIVANVFGFGKADFFQIEDAADRKPSQARF